MEWLVIWIVVAIVGAIVASNKGRSGVGTGFFVLAADPAGDPGTPSTSDTQSA